MLKRLRRLLQPSLSRLQVQKENAELIRFTMIEEGKIYTITDDQITVHLEKDYEKRV